MEKKKFVFEKTVYLSDTNAEGNVYFAKYFEWQGQSREEFVKTYVPNILKLLQEGLVMITCEAHCYFLKPAFLFDQIEIEIRTSDVKKASFNLVFIFKNKNSNEVIATGIQKIAFSSKEGKLMPIPDAILKQTEFFLEDNPSHILKQSVQA